MCLSGKEMKMSRDFISKCKLFEGLSKEEAEQVVEGLSTIVIPAGSPVISEHGQGDNVYIIVKGAVEINKELGEKDEGMAAQLKILEEGDFFGEMSLLDNEPRSANVISRDNAELISIPKERFLKLAFSHPLVLFNLIRTLSWRLRDTNDKFVEVMNKLIAQNRLMAIGMAASKIIHDIKTPLTVIVLTAQLVENMHPEIKEFTESIVRQTQAIDQMVREILDYAKGNTTPINPQKINLDTFLGEIKETISYTIQGRKLEFFLENRMKQDVWFDENRVRRVLVNLLKNAAEAVKDPGYIRLDSYLEDDNLYLIVSDNGPGVSERIRPQLFNPFQSEGKSRGTGLGLAICQKLVNEHHGSIEYKPNEPHGAMFIIRLPQQADK